VFVVNTLGQMAEYRLCPECLTAIFSLYNNALPNTGISCDVPVRMDVVELFH